MNQIEQTDTEYLYIIYNADYGGYSMNMDFIIELFKRYPSHTKIGKQIFKMTKLKENDINYNKNSLDNLNMEYFMHYVITENKIINTKTNEYYYISEHCTELRANQYLVEYIFERTFMKIIKNGEFTPYFLNSLFQFDKTQFSNQITEQEAIDRLIELEHLTQKEIDDYVPAFIIKRVRRRRIIEDNNGQKFINNIKFYKNGFKQNNIYYEYKTNINVNINKNNIFDTLSDIANGALIDFIIFYDINGTHASLSLDRIKKGYIWKISEYDGVESIKLSLPYDNIIEDLLNHIWKTENYEPKTNLTLSLIDKSKTLTDLAKEMY
jgi:hypothetical protein